MKLWCVVLPTGTLTLLPCKDYTIMGYTIQALQIQLHEIVHQVQWECSSRYVGRITQRLSDRIKQHVSSVIWNKTVPLKINRKGNVHLLKGLILALVKQMLRQYYSDSKFSILTKCRSVFFLKIMESMYIKFNIPDLCQEKEFVFNLALTWCSIPPMWDDIIAFTSGISTSW